MPLYWLCYRHNNSIVVVIGPAHSLVYARLRASLDESEFTEDPVAHRQLRLAISEVSQRWIGFPQMPPVMLPRQPANL